MPKQKQATLIRSQQLPYYTGRVVQRVSLLLAAGSTMIIWGTLLAVSQGFVFTNSLQGAHLTHLDELSLGITGEVNTLIRYAASFSVAALLITLAMLAFPRVVRYEKRLVVDGVVVAVFLFFAAVFSQSILQFILSHLAG